jgi:hypothetical protein
MDKSFDFANYEKFKLARLYAHKISSSAQDYPILMPYVERLQVVAGKYKFIEEETTKFVRELREFAFKIPNFEHNHNELLVDIKELKERLQISIKAYTEITGEIEAISHNVANKKSSLKVEPGVKMSYEAAIGSATVAGTAGAAGLLVTSSTVGGIVVPGVMAADGLGFMVLGGVTAFSPVGWILLSIGAGVALASVVTPLIYNTTAEIKQVSNEKELKKNLENISEFQNVMESIIGILNDDLQLLNKMEEWLIDINKKINYNNIQKYRDLINRASIELEKECSKFLKKN